MEYLEYLADYTYDELPEAIRSGIRREDYEERRQLVQLLDMPRETTLPPALAAAFVAATAANDQARTQAAGKGKRSKVRWLPWLAAAGWLLFLGVSSVLLLREPETRMVVKTIFAPAPAPEIIHTTDTLYQTVTAYKYQTRVVRDTVYQEVPLERLVHVRDTLYLPQERRAQLVNGSSSLRGKEGMLSFLYGTE